MNKAGRVRPATPEDIPRTHALIRELAEYERALDQVNIGEEVLLRDGFGPDPAYGLLVLEPADRLPQMADKLIVALGVEPQLSQNSSKFPRKFLGNYNSYLL